MPFQFRERVEDYVGEVTDTGGLTDWLTAGARRLVDLIPLHKAHRMATSLTIPAATPVDVSMKRILGVYKGGYEAIRVPLGFKTDLTATGSMRYATARSPSYIIENQQLSIYPTASAGTAEVVAYPEDVMFSDDTIPNFPPEAEELVVLYASLQVVLSYLRKDAESIAAIPLQNPTATLPPAVVPPSTQPPAAPSLTAVTYTDAVAGVITGAILPVINVPDAPTLPAIGDITPFFPQTKSWPVNFDTFIATQLDTYQDIELAAAKMSQAQTMLQKYVAEVNEEASRVDADAKRVNAEAVWVRSQTDLYQAEIQAFQAEVQKAIEQGRLEQQALIEAAKATTDVNLQNNYRRMEAIIANNRSLLEQYTTGMRAYETAINAYAAEVQAYVGQAQIYASEVRKNVEYYTAEIQRYAARQQEWNVLFAGLSKTYRDGLTLFIGGNLGDDKATA